MTAPTVVPADQILVRCAQNESYRKAVETPEHLELVDRRARAIRMRGDLSRAERIPPAPNAGDDWQPWLDEVALIAERERARAAKLDALNAEIARCEVAIAGLAVDSDRIIRSLGFDLAATWRDVKATVRRLNGHHTAAAIVAAGDPDALAAWQGLTLLADRVDAIYAAFDWATANDPAYMNGRSEYLFDVERGDSWADESRVKNIGQVFPAWKRPAANIALMRWDHPDPRPYPAERLARLVWLVTSGAELWTPTRHELRQIRSQQIAERAHPNGPPQQQQKQAESRVLNKTPSQRTPDYSRVAAAIEARQQPTELAELGAIE
jgi:hypothetical protein